jgi:hypothetical protein
MAPPAGAERPLRRTERRYGGALCSGALRPRKRVDNLLSTLRSLSSKAHRPNRQPVVVVDLAAPGRGPLAGQRSGDAGPSDLRRVRDADRVGRRVSRRPTALVRRRAPAYATSASPALMARGADAVRAPHAGGGRREPVRQRQLVDCPYRLQVRAGKRKRRVHHFSVTQHVASVFAEQYCAPSHNFVVWSRRRSGMPLTPALASHRCDG